MQDTTTDAYQTFVKLGIENTIFSKYIKTSIQVILQLKITVITGFPVLGTCTAADAQVLSLDGSFQIVCEAMSRVTQITVWRRTSGGFTDCPTALEIRLDTGQVWDCGRVDAGDQLYGIVYLFSTLEHVLAVEVCIHLVSGYQVVTRLTFYTNFDVYGPYGFSSCSGTNYVLLGFELVGIGVKSGSALDRVRFSFDRCN